MKTLRILTLYLFAIFFLIDTAVAQRGVTYRELTFRNTSPGFYYDQTVLPVESGHNVNLHFKFVYSALNFRAISAYNGRETPPETAGFFSDVELIVEIFDSKDKDSDPLSVDITRKRLTWNGTAFADSYDETRKPDVFHRGTLSLELEPGRYIHRIQIKSDGKNVRLGSNQRSYKVPDFKTKEGVPVQFVASQDGERLDLLNYGQSVLYAQNFKALVLIPDFIADEDTEFKVHIDEVRMSASDTSFVETVYTAPVKRDEISGFSEILFRSDDDGEPYLIVRRGEDNKHTMLLVNIPNRKFKNTSFQIWFTKNGASFTQHYYRSLWIDIPASLLNLDVAIEMLKYIVDQSNLRELRSGSVREREEKFRKFWAERDPEPESDFNPLMVEFYNRVDTAFERFSSPNRPGYDSDRGKILLRFGEPREVTRKFPANRPATEVWRYANRTYVFEATTGFGDFVLVRTERD